MEEAQRTARRTTTTRWQSLREKLGFDAFGCCGAACCVADPTILDGGGGEASTTLDASCLEVSGAAEEMNLEAALAAEREVEGTPERVSLMRLLEEREREEEEEAVEGWRCCVCMGRRKGAAFIPCGHAFCRACARELWLGRGACALCNRPVLEILDIF